MRPFVALFAALGSTLALATVNVNTAQQSELQRVKGLDKVKAKSIIEWRAANGSIDNFAELESVPGMTHDVVAKARAELAFDGPAYVPSPKAKVAEKKKSPAQTNLAARN
jgi:competence ComEA-like helix-hairpin-helix protein